MAQGLRPCTHAAGVSSSSTGGRRRKTDERWPAGSASVSRSATDRPPSKIHRRDQLDSQDYRERSEHGEESSVRSGKTTIGRTSRGHLKPMNERKCIGINVALVTIQLQFHCFKAPYSIRCLWGRETETQVGSLQCRLFIYLLKLSDSTKT